MIPDLKFIWFRGTSGDVAQRIGWCRDESIAVVRQPGAEHRYLQGSCHIVGLDRRGAIALRQK
jgi:hypothetical protein